MKAAIALLLALFGLAGCLSSLGGGGVGRFESFRDVRNAEEATKRELLKTKQEEFKARQNNKNDNPTLRVTTQDSAGRPVIAEMYLAPTIEAVVGHKGNNDTYGIDISTTAMPKGAVAESLDSAGMAGERILNTSSAVIGVTGAAVVGAIRETGGGGTHINGETINTHDSFNRSEVHATGEGNTAGTTARQDNTTMAEEAEGEGVGDE